MIASDCNGKQGGSNVVPASQPRFFDSLSHTSAIGTSFFVTLVCAAAFAQPRIDRISPAQGPIAGGTIVTITGANLAGVTVKLDRDTIAPMTQSDSTIQLQMPAHDNGYALITVSNTSGVVRREFLYVPPRLDELRPGEITTVAGVGRYAHLYGPATQAMINASGCDFDDAGNTDFTDPNANRIYVVRADGTIEPFAGTGFPTGPAGDGGPAADAVISFPHNIALDGAGNMYVPDGNDRIRKIDANGIITTIGGTGVRGYSGDGGPAIAAKIANPSWIAANREDVFFIDSDNMRVRKIHLADGIITTIAGDGVAGFSGDGGPAVAARFNEASPDEGGLVLDGAGSLYLDDARNSRIRRIDLKSGIITTALAVNGGNYLGTFALDPQGNFYYSSGGYITKASPSGATLAVWGHTDGTRGFTEDGADAATALYAQINYVRIDRAGNIVFDDSSVGRLRRINIATGKLETIAGIGPGTYAENGPATAAVLNVADGGDLDFAASGELLIADTWNARIRRLDASGNVTTIAGNGMLDGPVDGAQATLTGVVALAIDADANGIDVVPFGKVARLDSNGIFHAVTRFLGGGTICHYSGDGGKVLDGGLCQPWDTARDRAGNLYIADTNNNRIRRVDATSGTITTIAGNGGPVNGFERYGHGTFCGDGGPAITACLNTPYGVVVDNDGNIFVSEFHARLRKIDTNGVISTYEPNFNATKLRVDAAGSVFGVGGWRVMRIDRSGVTTTLAGTGGVNGFSGDGGPARSAKISWWGESQGLAIDREGNLFFIDTANHRVRVIRYGAVLAPPDAAITAVASGASITATVRHVNGKPAPSVRVDFAAPSSGPSCALSSPFAVTDANGVARVTCTPNCIAGAYSVTARPLTATATASVSFTNASVPCRRRAVRH